MKKKNGFTLVELLAVIVVLAIIMIIAIPSVLDTMNQARKQSFALYVNKVVTAVQQQYTYDSNGGAIQGAGLYVYDITQDLGLTSTGSYKGYVTVNANDVDNPKYIIELYDNNYILHNYNVIEHGMPTQNSDRIQPRNAGTKPANHPYVACSNAVGSTKDVSCYTRKGLLISPVATENN